MDVEVVVVEDISNDAGVMISPVSIQIDLRGACIPYGAGTAAQDYSLDGSVNLRDSVERMDFAIDIDFP